MKDRVLWLQLSDSHEDIISQHKLHEGAGRVNFVRVEISPDGGDLSLPLDQWRYAIDQKETPDWYDAADCEARTRVALKEWAESKFTGWNVYEAFHPVNPFKLNPKPLSRKRALELVRQWASVMASVRASVFASESVGASVVASERASVRASVFASVVDSVMASVRDSVVASVMASVGGGVEKRIWANIWNSIMASVRPSVVASEGVWAYCGGLFVPRVTVWRYAEKLGPNPWEPLTTLWHMGYVPSFDGKAWRLHCGEKAATKYEFTIEEISNAGGKHG
jgi:hypothetical protein